MNVLDWGLGHGCSTAVDHMPRNQEVVGVDAAGYWAFFLLSFPTFLQQWSVLNQVPQGGASLKGCCESNKNGCLAAQTLVVQRKSKVIKANVFFLPDAASCP